MDLAAPLQQAEDGYLAACAATAPALASASKIALVHLDLTSEPLGGLCAQAGGNGGGMLFNIPAGAQSK
jgi:hypothetical protein